MITVIQTAEGKVLVPAHSKLYPDDQPLKYVTNVKPGDAVYIACDTCGGDGFREGDYPMNCPDCFEGCQYHSTKEYTIEYITKTIKSLDRLVEIGKGYFVECSV